MRTENSTSRYIRETFDDLEFQIETAQTAGYRLTEEKILDDLGVLKQVAITFANHKRVGRRFNFS